jgi:ABC-type multidrug transport system ATPase subunit
MTVEPTPTLGDLECASEFPTPNGSAKDNGVAVSIEEIKYLVNKKKDKLVILDGITAIFAPGKMTALMGPSGCGKTTLLDVVAGRKNSGTITGDIKYGGVSPKKEALKHCVGYVEQFDTLVGELTVRQMLMYTAELRLPTTVPTKDKVARVDETIARLDLSSCTNTVIGNALQRGISGGQAKRVNLALSLIMRPSVIYLDEPTSGLDSNMANEVADCLRSLSSAASCRAPFGSLRASTT